MANLDPVMRELVMEIRVSGRAKKQKDVEKKKGASAVAAKMPSPSTLQSPPSKEELSGEELMELLLKLNKERGTTLIIVTHDPEIAELTQRTIVIRDGVVVN
jgi:predicted ABC-type transport system involved in lysophospholipase L1 biosynthesis ATPase subunit